MIELINKDNIIVLKEYPDNYFDSIVTDPPYGISFMNNKWDYQLPNVEFWKEILRVLKPGGYAIVACGTRTQHRMAVNLEDSGFEIRDIISWIYGTGFPKSLDISKSIDKKFKVERKILCKNPNHRNKRNNNLKNMLQLSDGNISLPESDMAKKWEGWGTGLKPAMELWTLCRKPLEENTIVENILKWEQEL